MDEEVERVEGEEGQVQDAAEHLMHFKRLDKDL